MSRNEKQSAEALGLTAEQGLLKMRISNHLLSRDSKSAFLTSTPWGF